MKLYNREGMVTFSYVCESAWGAKYNVFVLQSYQMS